MNHLDELLFLYPTCKAPVRGVARYVLGQLLPRRLALELGAHG